MSAEEAHELQEHAEHGRGEMLRVSLTMSIIAVLVAGVSVLAQRGQTEELLLQTRVTDQWAYYQAKAIRRTETELFTDLLGVAEFRDRAAQEKLAAEYRHRIADLREQQDELQQQTREREAELGKVQRRVGRLEIGEALLEVGLVITSITLLTRRFVYWHLGMGFAAAGILFAILGLLVR